MPNSSPPMNSPEEQEQLLQTIEMFEVIVQANPHDCQSLEILKDAYTRLGMKKEILKVSRRMAQTFTELGQFATAILEYEQILREEPDNPEIIAAMGDCEERMHNSSKLPPMPKQPTSTMGAPVEGGQLMTTSATNRGDARAASSMPMGHFDASASDGNEALAKFLIQHRLAPADIVNASLAHVQKVNSALRPSSVGLSLIEDVIDRGGAELDPILCGILDRTKFAYIPLENYDVDRHVVRMLPEDLTLRRLIVPFDVVSRTMMIATANPFDAAAKETAQSLLDYNIQWHIASPQAIARVLMQAYRIGQGGGAKQEAPAPAAAAPFPAPSTEAPVFGEIPTPLPIPELKTSSSNTPLSQGDAQPGSPLPDTSDFRLK